MASDNHGNSRGGSQAKGIGDDLRYVGWWIDADIASHQHSHEYCNA